MTTTRKPRGIAARFWAGASVYNIATDLFWQQQQEQSFERYRLHIEQVIRRDHAKVVKAGRNKR